MNVRHRAILVLLGAWLLHGCSGKLILTRPLEVERDDWPAFGRTAEHTHEASGPVRPPLELRWEYDLGAGAIPAKGSLDDLFGPPAAKPEGRLRCKSSPEERRQ